MDRDSMTNNKNVIYLIIDSLRYDRLGIGGNKPSPSPVIDNLMSSNMYFTNMFSVGCPTEFAYPGLETSSLPLDCGGYARRISGREISLAEIFRNNGYDTVRFVTDYSPSFGKQDRGFEECYYLYDLFRFFADINDNIPYFQKLWKSENKTIKYFISVLDDYLETLFIDIIKYCEHVHNNVNNNNIKQSLILHDYGLGEVIKIITKEKELFSENKETYIINLLNSDACQYLKEIMLIVNARKCKTAAKVNQRRAQWFLIKTIPHILQLVRKGRVSKSVIKTCLHQILKKELRFPSSGWFVDNFIHWLDKRQSEKPFFAWIHLLDIHDNNFTTFDVPYDKNAKNDISSLKKLRKEIKQQREYFGNPIYDYGVRYTDLQIGRLVESLRQKELLDKTIIVLVSDHGHYGAGWPIRSNTHIARDFHDELYHIPVAFIHKDIKLRIIKKLCSSLDIAPTLLKLLNISIPESFKGVDVGNQAIQEREYVIMEHLGPGPCDFRSKPIKVCIRSKTNKLLYEVLPDQETKNGCVKEYFDITKDPFEKIRLKDIKIMSEIGQKMLFIAQNRVKQIREQIVGL